MHRCFREVRVGEGREGEKYDKLPWHKRLLVNSWIKFHFEILLKNLNQKVDHCEFFELQFKFKFVSKTGCIQTFKKARCSTETVKGWTKRNSLYNFFCSKDYSSYVSLFPRFKNYTTDSFPPEASLTNFSRIRDEYKATPNINYLNSSCNKKTKSRTALKTNGLI